MKNFALSFALRFAATVLLISAGAHAAPSAGQDILASGQSKIDVGGPMEALDRQK